MTTRRRQPGPSECGPRKDFSPKKGFWHCCSCHRGFTRKPDTLACPHCKSEDIFDTMDKEGWRLADEENSRPKVRSYE